MHARSSVELYTTCRLANARGSPLFSLCANTSSGCQLNLHHILVTRRWRAPVSVIVRCSITASQICRGWSICPPSSIWCAVCPPASTASSTQVHRQRASFGQRTSDRLPTRAAWRHHFRYWRHRLRAFARTVAGRWSFARWRRAMRVDTPARGFHPLVPEEVRRQSRFSYEVWTVQDVS